MPPKGKAKAGARRGSSLGRGSASPVRHSAPKGRAAKARVEEAGEAAEEKLLENKAATHLQALARGWLARRLVEKLRETWLTEKAAIAQREAELAEYLADAELSMLRAERHAEELELERAAERKRKKEELERNIEAFVAAAFDGEVAEATLLLDKDIPVEARNRRGVTALSEAACGGHPDMVRLLLEKRGDPNCRCEFARTPLWRASYRGHLPVVRLLLESGGDPRIANEMAELPEDVAPEKEIADLLRRWDTSRTEVLVQQYESWLESERLLAESTQAQAMQSVEMELEKARQDHAIRQKVLAHARAGLRRRIRDHDTLLAEGKPHCVLLKFKQACQEFEARVSRAQAEADDAQRRLDRANISQLTAAEACGAEINVEQGLGRAVQVRDLNDVLLRDVGDQIAQGDQWFLFIDPSDCAPKFLQYSGNAVLHFWAADEMEPGHIRRALLSMLRAGGVLAINLVLLGAGTDLELLAEPFEAVRPGLFQALMSRRLLLPDESDPVGDPLFHKLIQEEGDLMMFSPTSFVDERTMKFKFVVLTSSSLPHEDLLNSFDVLRVVPNTS